MPIKNMDTAVIYVTFFPKMFIVHLDYIFFRLRNIFFFIVPKVVATTYRTVEKYRMRLRNVKSFTSMSKMRTSENDACTL